MLAHARLQVGFTLVELLLAIVLLGLLATVGASMLVDSFRVSTSLQAEQLIQYEARYALERIARELREVKRLAVGTPCISVMGPQRVVFRRTIGRVSPVDEDFLDRSDCMLGTQPVEIAQFGSRLTIAYAGDARSLTERVAVNGSCPDGMAFCLSYLAEDGATPVTALTQADLVSIRITLDLFDASAAQSLSQSLLVTLRNR